MSKTSDTPNRQNKYRPSLSAPVIEYIIQVVEDAPESYNKFEVLLALGPLIYKIRAGLVKPNYTARNKGANYSSTRLTTTQLLDELGGLDAGNIPIKNNSSDLGCSKAHYWEECYLKDLELVEEGLDPKEHLSKDELDAVQQHRFLNDLMTDGEAEDFIGGMK